MDTNNSNNYLHFIEKQLWVSQVFIFQLPQPGEEGRDGLKGHALTQLLGRVFARLPLVERVLGDDVLVIKLISEENHFEIQSYLQF